MTSSLADSHYSAAWTLHANEVAAFLLLASPLQGDYNNLKSIVTYEQSQCNNTIAWYGPSGSDELNASQIAILNIGVSVTTGDLSALATFAVSKGLTA